MVEWTESASCHAPPGPIRRPFKTGPRPWKRASLALLVLFGEVCRGGTVHTLSGKAYQGLVSVDARGFLLVNQPMTGLVRVNGDDVLEATFREVDEPPAMRQGVVLTDGTAVAGEIISADETTLHLARDGKDVAVPLDRVARVLFRPVPGKTLADLPAGRYGAALDSGDFFEGEFKGISDGRVRFDSVLFGAAQFVPGRRRRPCCWRT